MRGSNTTPQLLPHMQNWWDARTHLIQVVSSTMKGSTQNDSW